MMYGPLLHSSFHVEYFVAETKENENCLGHNGKPQGYAWKPKHSLSKLPLIL